METVLLWIFGVVLFLFVISFSVGVHEAAHMAFGKLFKLDVPKYFIGFGPKIWSFKTSKTEYGFKWIPMGGYVIIEDPSIQDKKNPNKELLSNVHPLKRIVIFSAGAIVNIILGVVITASVLLTVPVEHVTTTVQQVPSCSQSSTSCGASAAGVRAGDKIVKIDGKKFTTFVDLRKNIQGKKDVQLVVERNGSHVVLNNVAVKNNKIGIVMKSYDRQKTVGESLTQVGTIFKMNGEAILKLPSKIPGIFESLFGAKRDTNGISSVVAVGQTYGDVASSNKISIASKIQTFMLYSGLINIGLGIMNLLPILPLDGGRVFFAFIDLFRIVFAKIFRRKYSPLNEKYIITATAFAGTFVIGFMILLILVDIINPINVLG